MKSTREKILHTLLTYPGSTINELAESVGINGISIRHHLTSLEADDLVISAEERHGVGRPRLIYSLTDKGVEEFPTRYLQLTKLLIRTLKDNMTSGEIRSLFGGIGAEIAQTYKGTIEGKSLEERLPILKSIMSHEGFLLEYKKEKDSYIITSLSCPYNQIIKDHPEICSIDHQLISELLSTTIELQSCILNEDEKCSFRIPIKKSENINE